MIGSWLLITLALFVHLIFLLNTRFTLWPEMVMYPYLLNSGFTIYRDIINPYPPLLSFALANFARIFGYHPYPYQILTWGIILVTDIVIFIISSKIFKKKSYAFISTLFFIFFSVPFSINGLWFDLIQTPIIIVAIYYFYKFITSQKYASINLFFSIFSLTIAFYIKQQVLWLFLWFFIILFIKFGKKAGNVITKNAYVFLPFVVLLVFQIIFFWQKELLRDFLFWNFYFPVFISSKMPGYILLPTIRQFAVLVSLFLLFIPIIFKKKYEINLIVISAFFIILFAYPRFDYFHLIPALSILSLAFGQNFKSFLKAKVSIQLAFVLSLIFLFLFTARYFKNNWTQEIRFFEKEIAETALILNRITDFADPIYIQNGPDQLLALSSRLPPKPWADEFPWYLEIPGIQEKVVKGIIKQNPKYIIFKPYDIGLKYQLGVYRPKEIAGYIEDNYKNFIQISDTLWLKVPI